MFADKNMEISCKYKKHICLIILVISVILVPAIIFFILSYLYLLFREYNQSEKGSTKTLARSIKDNPGNSRKGKRDNNDRIRVRLGRRKRGGQDEEFKEYKQNAPSGSVRPVHRHVARITGGRESPQKQDTKDESEMSRVMNIPDVRNKTRSSEVSTGDKENEKDESTKEIKDKGEEDIGKAEGIPKAAKNIISEPNRGKTLEGQEEPADNRGTNKKRTNSRASVDKLNTLIVVDEYGKFVECFQFRESDYQKALENMPSTSNSKK